MYLHQVKYFKVLHGSLYIYIFNIDTEKPLNVKWENNLSVEIVKLTLVTGEFNTHITTCGYDGSDEVGEVL